MGTTHSLDAFVGKLEKAPKALLDSRKDMVSRSALVVTTAIRTEIHGVAPAGIMRGVGRGAKVGARFSLKTGTTPTALITAQGPLHLLERNTKAHDVGVARIRGRRAGKGAPILKIGDDFARGPIHHPGTKGKHPFEKGAERGQKLVPEVMRRTTHSHLAKVFSG